MSWFIKYRTSKRDAARRGIEFLLTFDEWYKLWKDSGHLHERGRCKGQYQLARIGDKGPYAIGNVKVITTEENRAEQVITPEHARRIGSKNGTSKLTEGEVLEIREQHEAGMSISDISREYCVSKQVISGIIKKQAWTHV